MSDKQRQEPPIPFEKLLELKKRLDEVFYGYDTAKLAILLGLVSGLPTMLVGDPGTVKSSMIEIVARSIDGVKDNEYFYALMTPYTREEEILGPISVKDLDEKGLPKVNVEGYLPTAKVVFLNQFFDAPGWLLTNLYSALKERLVRYAGHILKLPWIVFYAASDKVVVRDSIDVKFLDKFAVISYLSLRALDRSYSTVGLDTVIADVLGREASPSAQGTLFREQDVVSLQRYIILVHAKNSKDKERVKEYMKLIFEVLPDLDEMGKFSRFYRNIDGGKTVSLRRVTNMYTLANAIAYLTGDDEPHWIHMALAIILSLPVGYTVYTLVLNRLKPRVVQWLKDYLKGLVSSSSSLSPIEQACVELNNLSEQLKEYDDLLSSYLKMLGDQLKRRELLELFRAASSSYVEKGIVTLLSSLVEVIERGEPISVAWRRAADQLRGFVDAGKVLEEERTIEKAMANAVGVVYYAANNCQSLRDTASFRDEGQIRRVGENKMSKLLSLEDLETSREIVKKAKTMKNKLDAINEVILKPLLWAYGFDLADKETYDQILEVQKQLFQAKRVSGITPNCLPARVKELEGLIDELKEKERQLAMKFEEFKREALVEQGSDKG